MDKFVVGFAFDSKSEQILLITKNRPEWQKGCLNGIGGKIEIRETPSTAMKRESMEETGLNLNWFRRGVMTGKNNDGMPFECHIFYAYDNQIYFFNQIEDEPLALYDVDKVNEYPIIRNLFYLIPFGRSIDRCTFITLEY